MALSSAAAALRSLQPTITAALGSATGRAVAAGSYATVTPTGPSQQKPASIVEPTYTYMPPGSSMREPLYFSTSDPVYFVDPKPDPSAALVQGAAAAPVGEEKAAVSRPAQEARPPAAGSSAATSTPRKIDFSSISGKPTDNGRPVSYRMVDDLAHVPYVTNPATHSMREPKYVSVSDPKYIGADKK